MSNEFFVFVESKINESIIEEKNANFDTLPEMAPKSDEPQYCNKNFATPKATNLNYQPGVHTNLRAVGIVYAADTFLFLV